MTEDYWTSCVFVKNNLINETKTELKLNPKPFLQHSAVFMGYLIPVCVKKLRHVHTECFQCCLTAFTASWKILVQGWGDTVPKPVRVVGIQITSRKRETTLITAVIAFPYLWWNGSSSVTQFVFLIGSTKAKPPYKEKKAADGRKLHLFATFKYDFLKTQHVIDIQND